MRKPEPSVDVTQAPIQEFRVACANVGEIGHHDHAWIKARPSLAVRYAEKRTNEVQGTRYAQVELPFKIQTRVVSRWEDAVIKEVEDDVQRVDLDDSVGVGVDVGGVSVERAEGTETAAGDSGVVWEGSEPGVTGVQEDGDGEVGAGSRFGAIGASGPAATDDSSAD